MNITIENGPDWLQYAVALGTVGAAIFAGVAARVAATATRATRDLVELETTRDQVTQNEALWRQARRVTVDMQLQTPHDCDRPAADVFVQVSNWSPDPLRHLRLKVAVGDCSWGPQLLGTLGPHGRLTLHARLFSVGEPTAVARFADVEGRYFVVDAGRTLEQDVRPTEVWIAEGRSWATRTPDTMSVEERGILGGDYAKADFESFEFEVEQIYNTGDRPAGQPGHPARLVSVR